MHIARIAIALMAAMQCGANLTAQTPPADVGVGYGGAKTGAWITLPIGAGGVRAQPEPAVLPGGPDTEPETSGEMNGWNGSKSRLKATNDTTTRMADAKTFAKMQTIRIALTMAAPAEMHWELQGSAKVGGIVKALFKDAHGSCHSAAQSVTAVIYGAAQKVKAEDRQTIALVHASSAQVGGGLQVLGCGPAYSASYDVATSSVVTKALAGQDTGNQTRATSAVIDYTQRGDMAYSFKRQVAGTPAVVDTEAVAKGSATLVFFLVNGI